jgi:hypothetical protein
MGQYHWTINLTKKEFIHPHKIGLGLKLLEQVGFEGSMGDILVMLLACSNDRGGGDIRTETTGLVGRWAGDKIAIIGDYTEKGDIKRVDTKAVVDACRDGGEGYKDISDEIVPLLNEQFGFHLDVNEEGWRGRGKKVPMKPDIVIGLPPNT